MPRVLGGSQEGERFLMSEVPLYEMGTRESRGLRDIRARPSHGDKSLL